MMDDAYLSATLGHSLANRLLFATALAYIEIDINDNILTDLFYTF